MLVERTVFKLLGNAYCFDSCNLLPTSNRFKKLHRQTFKRININVCWKQLIQSTLTNNPPHFNLSSRNAIIFHAKRFSSFFCLTNFTSFPTDSGGSTRASWRKKSVIMVNKCSREIKLRYYSFFFLLFSCPMRLLPGIIFGEIRKLLPTWQRCRDALF